MSRLPKSPATQVSSDTSKSAVLRICPDPKYLAGSGPWFFRLYYKHQKFKENYLNIVFGCLMFVTVKRFKVFNV